MQNPFETILNRLDNTERLLNELLSRSAASAQPAPEIGGIELAQEITLLSKARIYTLVSERILPHSKRGGRLYFNRADLLAWVREGNRATA